MPHHGNEEEHNTSASQQNTQGNGQEPVIRDNRKVDPVTGQARHPEGGQSAPGAGSRAGAADSDGDALAQAEEILNGVDVPAEDSVAQGAPAGSAGNAEAAELPALDDAAMARIAAVYDERIAPHVHQRW